MKVASRPLRKEAGRVTGARPLPRKTRILQLLPENLHHHMRGRKVVSGGGRRPRSTWKLRTKAKQIIALQKYGDLKLFRVGHYPLHHTHTPPFLHEDDRGTNHRGDGGLVNISIRITQSRRICKNK